MRIAIIDHQRFAYAVDQIDHRPISGSHSVLCLVAAGLAARGHEVTLMGQFVPHDAVRLGVRHLALDRMRRAVPHDVAIVVNGCATPDAAATLVGADAALVSWMHNHTESESARPFADPAVIGPFARLVFVSEWQAGRFVSKFGLSTGKAVVIPNALTPAIADLIGPDEPVLAGRDPDQLVYLSAPIRGLRTFEQIWPLMLQRRPSLRLAVYGDHTLIQFHGEDQPKIAAMLRRIGALPNVELRPSVGKVPLAAALRRAAMLCYPATYPETACLAAVEAMAAGCLCSVTAIGGLPETTAGFAAITPLQGAGFRPSEFVDRTIGLLEARDQAPAAMEERLREQIGQMRRRHAVGEAVRAWEGVLADAAGSRRGSAAVG
ncbi:MAG: glycosyltransferase family 4 protein [Alphaproteobacteria bacterium]